MLHAHIIIDLKIVRLVVPGRVLRGGEGVASPYDEAAGRVVPMTWREGRYRRAMYSHGLGDSHEEIATPNRFLSFELNRISNVLSAYAYNALKTATVLSCTQLRELELLTVNFI